MAQNQAAASPGAFIKDATGGLIKIGPTHVGPTAPNATPAGFAGNSLGEQWVDTSGPKPILKTWDGSKWLESGGGATVSTGDTAPANPVNGDLWFRTDRAELFVWYADGSSAQWVEANTGSGGGGGGGARVTTDDVAPANPSDGDLWWNSKNGKLYVWYDDGDTLQWVVASPGGPEGPEGAQGPQGVQGEQGIQGIEGKPGLDGLPTGAVIYHAASTAPAGYLKCNGAAISRTTYAALFAVTGTIFGAGDGSTTFNLPELRGEFLRGWDDGRGADPGRPFGTYQNQDYLSHGHGVNDPGHVHSYARQDYGAGVISGGDYTVGGPLETTGGASATNISIAAAGGAETRPRNTALLACIKY